jgi:hypothetical protein
VHVGDPAFLVRHGSRFDFSAFIDPGCDSNRSSDEPADATAQRNREVLDAGAQRSAYAYRTARTDCRSPDDCSSNTTALWPATQRLVDAGASRRRQLLNFVRTR